MSRKEILGDVGRIVVKVGTSSVTMGGGGASSKFLDSVSDQVKALRDAGKDVFIVTSGAVGLGMRAMGASPNPGDIPMRQAAASVGQSILMSTWNESLSRNGLLAAQILLTMDVYSDRESALNLNNTIEALLDNGVVPIFNENDAISIKQIGPAFGDNDTLSAAIAGRLDADLLLILSDVDGLYDKNPKIHPDAKIVSTVAEITDSIAEMAGDSTSGVGVGGMRTKIRAAQMCRDAGCRMVIASSAVPDVILRVVSGEEIGTVFAADAQISKKRRWLKSAHACATIEVDEGAAKAVLDHRSLLPVGVTGVEGQFARGDVVNISCGGEVIAKGAPSYSSDEVLRIKGMHSGRIGEVLGRRSGRDVVSSENIAPL
ncbi:MAG: glutamate 5-kinase [Candidatus Methanoplasma sp.]|jgi:glutamate 5-kinase|nr:glutamate 5-kinase [Candidatus Methanoplasma sp.]